MGNFWPWIKKYKFWFIWTPLSIVWFAASFCIAIIYGTYTRGLAFLLLAPLVVIGLYFTNKRTQALESQNSIDSNRLLAETFAKSIELLGNDSVAVRQGAIYALGKIAQENEGERDIIVSTLCAFIRNNQSLPITSKDQLKLLSNIIRHKKGYLGLTEECYKKNFKKWGTLKEELQNFLCFGENEKFSEVDKSKKNTRQDKLINFKRLVADVEAAIKVITDISQKINKNKKADEEFERRKYNLSNILLPYADFSDANLSNFNLSDSHFKGCVFEEVKIFNSNLTGVCFFDKTNIYGIEMDRGTELTKANFKDTEFDNRNMNITSWKKEKNRLTEELEKPSKKKNFIKPKWKSLKLAESI